MPEDPELNLFSRISAAAIILLMLGVPSFAAERVALVIGNSAYKKMPALNNPKNDAVLMASTLRNLGFDVMTSIDADRTGISRAIRRFGKTLRAGGKDTVGLFYFAGHGVQSRGVNYLIPIGVSIDDEADLSIEAISASDVLNQMEAAGNTLNLIILDACRNNPFKGAMRSASRGLARIQAASGSLIAFAAAPGQVAADGTGANSPYTMALVAAMQQPGLSVEQVFKRTRVRVEKQTSSRQTPWEQSSLKGDFYFVPGKATPGGMAIATKPLPSRGPSTTAAERAWDNIKTTKNIRVLEAYAKRFRASFYATLARERLKELAGRRETPVAPPGAVITQRQSSARPVYLSPSFNCNNRLNSTERMICNNSTLAALDRKLDRRYLGVKDRLSGVAESKLKRTQRFWLRLRNGCGVSVDCVADAYYLRLDELSAY